MINLAPWRYRRILALEGGPIERIESGSLTVLGQARHQANAYLKSGLRREGTKKVLYGNADGSGTDRYPELARHKAISECLERWAHAVHGPGRNAYGFDIDPSSNGMAAYPAFFARRARQIAWAEAVERHAIISWWTGALDCIRRTTPWEEVDGYEVESPHPGLTVALLHAPAGQHSHAYGHAAGRTFAEAMARASIELARAQTVIGCHERRHQGPEHAVGAKVGLFERRCLFFASTEGHTRFQQRLSRAKDRPCTIRVAFDGEIPGPWSEYAHVWRVAFEPPHPEFLSSSDDFFFW